MVGRRRLGVLGPAGLLALVLVIAAGVAPASATPGPTKLYTAHVPLVCLLGGTINSEDEVDATFSADAPAYVHPGDTFSLSNVQAVLNTDAAVSGHDWAASFISLGASLTGGVVSKFVLDSAGANVTAGGNTINAAGQPPYNNYDVLEFNEFGAPGEGAGLPFGMQPLTAGQSISLNVPVALAPMTDTVNFPGTSWSLPTGAPAAYSVGTFTATGAVGSTASIAIDPAGAFTSTSGHAPYQLTSGGGGIFAYAGGFTSATPTFPLVGPVPVECDPPAATGTSANGQSAGSTYNAWFTSTLNPPQTPPDASAAVLGSVPIVGPAPTVTSVSPSSGAPAGGNTVTITGTGFSAGDAVSFGGSAAANVTVAGPTTITATAPSGTAGATVDVTVSDSVGQQSAAVPGDAYTYTSGCTADPTIAAQPTNVTVTAPAAPTFSVTEGPVPAGCSPATIQWQVSTDGGVTWTNIPGATSRNYSPGALGPAQNGYEYRVVLTNAHSATTSSAATVTVISACTYSLNGPSDVTVTAPNPAVFAVTVITPAGCPQPALQWQESTNGGVTFANVAGATSTTLTISPTAVSMSGEQFRVVMSNTVGTATSRAATLTVLPACPAPPTIAVQPVNAVVTPPASATFTVAEGAVPAGCAAATIQWQVSTDGGTTFTSISGATSGTLTINPTSVAMLGNKYRAVLVNAAGATNSNAATLIGVVTECMPPPVTMQPANATVTAPAAATFTSAASTPVGCSALVVQWQVSTDGGTTFADITGATSATYSTGPTTTAQSGNEYRAVWTTPGGSTASSAATLTVNPPVTNAPVVTGVLPSSGGGFSLVLIEGKNLRGAKSVSFGSHHAFFLGLTSTLIVALAPPAPAGVVDVTVTTGQGASATSSADHFTYTN